MNDGRYVELMMLNKNFIPSRQCAVKFFAIATRIGAVREISDYPKNHMDLRIADGKRAVMKKIPERQKQVQYASAGEPYVQL